MQSLIECLFGQGMWTTLPPALRVASSQRKSLSGSSSRAVGESHPFVKHWFRSRPWAEGLGGRFAPAEARVGPWKLDSHVSKKSGWKWKNRMCRRHETNVWPWLHECRVRGTTPRRVWGTTERDPRARKRFLWWRRDFLCPKYDCPLCGQQMRKNSFKRIPGVLGLLVAGRQESTWTGYQSTGVSSQTSQALEGRKELNFKQGSLLTTGTVFFVFVSQSSVWKVLFQLFGTSLRGYQ